VAGAEQVDRAVRAQPALGGGGRVDHVVVPVAVEEGDDGADGEHVEIGARGVFAGFLAKVGVGRPLYGRVDQHLARIDGFGVGEGLLGGCQLLLGLLAAHVRRRRDVDGRADVGADLVLELEDLGRRGVDLAVLRELERARVGDDRAREVEQLVEPLGLGALAQVVGVADDVGVRDQDLGAELLVELSGRNRLEVRVDHRHQRRRLDGDARTGHRQPADAGHPVGRPDLEGVAHGPRCGGPT